MAVGKKNCIELKQRICKQTILINRDIANDQRNRIVVIFISFGVNYTLF